MPVLANAKHELFAQELAKGRPAVEAYTTAGYKPDDGNASKLAGRPEVQARVQEITGAAAERAGVTVEAVVKELAKIGFSNMLDYMQVGPDGQPVLDFSKLSRDQAAAIHELVVDSHPEREGEGEDAETITVRRVRFKLADKRGALVDLGKHLGIFKERIEHTGPNGGPIATTSATPEQVKNELAAIFGAGADPKRPAAGPAAHDRVVRRKPHKGGKKKPRASTPG